MMATATPFIGYVDALSVQICFLRDGHGSGSSMGSVGLGWVASILQSVIFFSKSLICLNAKSAHFMDITAWA